MRFQKEKRPKMFKKCPRCQNKCLATQDRCEECGLLFSRLEKASNKAAKKKLAHFDRDYVIYTNQYPSDINWLRLLLLTFFTGLVGGHYYYTGKYIKGGIMSLGFVYLIFTTIFNAQIVATATEVAYFYAPIGVYAFAWIISLCYVAFKKYKVPVFIDENETKNDENKVVVLEKTEKKAKKSKISSQKVEKEEEK